MNRHDEMYHRIEIHGENLKRIFQCECDPIALCKRLRQTELKLNRLAVDYCNGDIDMDQIDQRSNPLIMRANVLLNTDRIWFNRDPRGYSLKFDPLPDEQIHRDWGGYGIIAPDLSESA